MEERFAPVTTATGALGPVLLKLAALLGDEYILNKKTRGDIMFIKSELEPVYHLLGKLWGSLDLDVACKNWMTEARELSYDMEDDIDGFTLGLYQRGDGGSFIQREATDSPFKEFVERVKDVSKQCGKMQKVGDAIICNRSKLTTDPRALFLHKDASELVGMEPNKKEIILLLQKYEMVCIFGFAGMGKTTLADLVYQTIGDEFQCRAFVSVHPSPNMTEILGTILSQVTDGAMSAGSGTEPAPEQNIVTDGPMECGTEPGAEQNDFIKGISNFLSDKRYLVIIDDIWHSEEWEVIRKALPKNNLGCKLIMTTRVTSIAEKCYNEQGGFGCQLYFGRAEAERLSAMRLSKSVEGATAKEDLIADMCDDEPSFDFCPLAVICLSSAWAESHHDGESSTWARHILEDGFLITPSLKPLVQSLCLGFDDLPLQLRTCLLYCTIYPPKYRFYKSWLVSEWIAEGFVSQVGLAEAYFDELVSRNLLRKPMRGWHAVHPIMRAFLVCKAKEENFIAYDGAGNSSHAKQIRRLSLCTDRCPDEDVLSHTRSLVVFGKQWQDEDEDEDGVWLDGVPFKAFKVLRVLEIRNSSRLENGHLVDICGLIWLKYLVLMGCRDITELPREIGRLQNLETLCLADTRISKLPTEIGKLQHLETLDVSDTMVTELPREMKNLERLETLDVSATYITELPTWIEKLQSLKTLDVRITEVTELPREIGKLQHLETLNVTNNTMFTELPTWIEKLKYLKTLDVSHTKVMELPTWIEKLQSLKTLDVSGTRVRELPKEIGKLQHLRTLDIRGTKVRELSCSKDLNPLLSVVVDEPEHIISDEVEKLMLGVISSSGGEAKCRDDLSILILFNHFGWRCEVLPVRMLRVAGRHMKIPQWVKQDLCNVCSLDIRLCILVHEDLEFLKTQMPNLQALQLRFEVPPRKPVIITAGGFPKLETFYVDCRLPQVITFGEGVMPKLKHLEFKFHTGTASQDYYMGIKHLDSLEKVVFRCSGYYRSDSPGIREAIDVLRNEAAEHPKEITLWVDDNDMHPEVFGRGALRRISLAIADKREKLSSAAERRSFSRERRGVPFVN